MSDFQEDVRRQLKSGLGTVLKMASSGLGTMREVVARSSEVGRKRVDLVLLRRERVQLLAKLGEALLPFVARGELEVSEAVRRLVDNLDDVNRRMQSATARVFDNAFGAPRAASAEIFAGNPDSDAFDVAESDAEPEPDPSPEPAERKPRRRKKR
jgi:hypothetical protein